MTLFFLCEFLLNSTQNRGLGKNNPNLRSNFLGGGGKQKEKKEGHGKMLIP